MIPWQHTLNSQSRIGGNENKYFISLGTTFLNTEPCSHHSSRFYGRSCCTYQRPSFKSPHMHCHQYSARHQRPPSPRNGGGKVEVVEAYKTLRIQKTKSTTEIDIKTSTPRPDALCGTGSPPLYLLLPSSRI